MVSTRDLRRKIESIKEKDSEGIINESSNHQLRIQMEASQ